MKRVLVSLCLLAVGGYAMAQATIKDENAQVREAKNFSRIHLSSAFDVYLTQGNEESVAVSASEERFRDDIVVEVKNGTLEIGYRPKNNRWNTGNKKLKAYISFKQIDELIAGGACDVAIVGSWKTDKARINVSGATDMKGAVDIAKLDIDISGASDLKLSGNADDLSVDASGASKFKGYELATDFCNASATGASDIEIRVSKELSVRASGASDVNYKGDGVIRDLKTSGASSVSKR